MPRSQESNRGTITSESAPDSARNPAPFHLLPQQVIGDDYSILAVEFWKIIIKLVKVIIRDQKLQAARNEGGRVP